MPPTCDEYSGRWAVVDAAVPGWPYGPGELPVFLDGDGFWAVMARHLLGQATEAEALAAADALRSEPVRKKRRAQALAIAGLAAERRGDAATAKRCLTAATNVGATPCWELLVARQRVAR